MKKTTGFCKVLLCCLLLLPVLTISAFADSGPKPQLVVRVVNAPEDLYYLDLVADGTGDYFPNLTEEELAALDGDLLDALMAAVPEGHHACMAQGSSGPPMWGDLTAQKQDASGNPLHTYGYVGLPETYQLLLVTESGESFLSEPQTRQVLQSSVTLDWADKSLTAPPVFLGYLLQFLSTLLPTLLIEGVLLLLFGFGWKRNWKPFLLVNLLTQGGLAAWVSYITLTQGPGWFFLYFSFIPAEAAIALAESLLYRRTLTGQSRTRALCYGLTANAVSAILGLACIVPVWQFIVSLS